MNRATLYAKRVINGSIRAGKYVRLACKRHLKDLKRQGTEEFPYIFSEEKADQMLDFAETLNIAEGDGGNVPLKLALFQCFILGSLFGWVHMDTGYRRFRTSYVQLGRQNGKSLLNGVLGLKCSNFDGYKYGQIYCTATKSDQAKIVLKEMIKMIEADEDLSELYKIQEYKSTIEALVTKSTIKALGRDSKSIDGFRPYLGIVDEYHAHPNDQMYRLLVGGTRKLKQCLISIITTAGLDLTRPCYEMYEYCKSVLDSEAEADEKMFIYIAQMDEEDDIWNPENWVKANPLAEEDPTMIDNIKDDALKAKQMGGKTLADFMTKALNIWVTNGDDQYVNIDKWKECASDITLDEMRGKECYVGLDLSSGGDLTSLALEFPIEMDERQKFYIHSHSFIPSERLAEHIKTDNAPYHVWRSNGLLTTTNGFKTDYKFIIQYMRDLAQRYDIRYKMICYDPHNADAFISDLEEFGVPLVEITQSARNLHQPTEDFKLEVDSGNILYNRDNGLLSWSIMNAKLEHNSFGECKITKNLRVKRIDPVDAVIDAHKMAMLLKEEVNLNEIIGGSIDSLYADFDG